MKIAILLLSIIFFSCRSIHDAQSLVNESKQIFLLDNTVEQTIFTKLGIRIYLPTNLINDDALYKDEKIQFEIHENYDTVSNPDSLFLTFIFKNQKGAIVSINKNAFFTIHIPKIYGEFDQYLKIQTQQKVWQTDSSTHVYKKSLDLSYERIDLIEQGLSLDRTIPRLPLKDTSIYRNFSQYFYGKFNFDTINYENFPTDKSVHIDLSVNQFGRFIDIKISRTSDSSFIDYMIYFLSSSPEIDYDRLNFGDTTSIKYGMSLKPLWYPPAHQMANGYRSSLSEYFQDVNLNIQFFRDATLHYNIYNIHQTGSFLITK